MLDDPLDLDPERVFRNYVAQCRRLHIKPAPRERAMAAIQEWADALAAARHADSATPPTKHQRDAIDSAEPPAPTPRVDSAP